MDRDSIVEYAKKHGMEVISCVPNQYKKMTAILSNGIEHLHIEDMTIDEVIELKKRSRTWL